MLFWAWALGMEEAWVPGEGWELPQVVELVGGCVHNRLNESRQGQADEACCCAPVWKGCVWHNLPSAGRG